MSYQVPVAYAAPEAAAIPSVLVGDELKQFAGMRSLIKYLPSASGTSISPSSSLLFNIPAEPYGYLKPNSMYLKGSVTVTWNASVSLAADEYGIGFAGNTYMGKSPLLAYNDPTIAVTNGSTLLTTTHGVGGASSLLNRVTVTLPGGASMSYGQHHHWRNAVIPHALSASYVQNDLREAECAGYLRPLGGAFANATPFQTFYFSIPMDVPVFNGSTAFPMLLCNGGISMEIVTSSLGDAFSSAFKSDKTAVPVTYEMKNVGLVYEVLQVSSEFKQALVATRADRGYMIHVADRTVVGPVGVTSSTRYNFGVGLSSCKGVLFTEYSQASNGQVKSTKGYMHNATDYYAVYRDGVQMTIPNINSSDVAYSEMQRTLGRIGDSNITSALVIPIRPPTDSNTRTSYSYSGAGSFLAGCSFQNISDWSFAAQGSPADQLAIEIYKASGSQTTSGGLPDSLATVQYAERWGRGFNIENTFLLIWVLYDSVVVVLPDGTCQIRK
jgi:hypothetical protein